VAEGGGQANVKFVSSEYLKLEASVVQTYSLLAGGAISPHPRTHDFAG